MGIKRSLPVVQLNIDESLDSFGIAIILVQLMAEKLTELFHTVSCIVQPVTDTQIFSTRYSVMSKVYIGHHDISETEPGLCACTVDNPLAKAWGLSLRTGAQTMFYLSLKLGDYLSVHAHKPCSISR